jgi:hypothetical protein
MPNQFLTPPTPAMGPLANASAPDQQTEGMVMGPQGQGEPSSIRDYLAIAKEGAARFTNIPGEQQPGSMYLPDETLQQGIPEGPASEYERIPFSTRAGMSPYVRAKERVRTMLPQLWEAMFPGMQQGATLNEQQMKQWTGAVEHMTGNLLKRFDKQYGAAQKVAAEGKKQRLEDTRYWHKDFWKQRQMGRPITDPEGNPISEAQYVSDRMNAGDEMKIKDMLRNEEPEQNQEFKPDQIKAILSGNPELKQKVLFQIRDIMQRTLGSLTDEQFKAAMQDSGNKSLKNKAIQETLEQYREEIMQFSQAQ